MGLRGDIHSSSVADLHRGDADSDPACHFDADPDPDPIFNFDADPDPSFQIKAQILKKCSHSVGSYSIYTFWLVICNLMRIRILLFNLMHTCIEVNAVCIQREAGIFLIWRKLK